MTKQDLEIIDDLLKRTDNLPEILHLRASQIGYEFTEEDKALLLETYQELDDILKEAAAFINVKFQGREDYIHGWNKIDFDTKIGDFKITTTDRKHIKRAWKNGVFDLKGLLKSLRNEVVLLIEPEKEKEKKQLIPKTLSFIEILSWIAGIIGTIIALYALFK